MECSLYIWIKSIWSKVLFKACVFLLIFCLDDLSIGVSGVLKSPTIIVLLPISLFMVVRTCVMYWGAPMFWCIIIYNCYIFLDWSFDHYVVSLLISCNSLYFKVYFIWYEYCYSSLWFPFAWSIFFHPLNFSLYVSLGLKWVSFRQHIYGSFFVSIQPVCVFWLEHLIHLHSRWLSICMFLLPFSFWFVFVFVGLFLLLCFSLR